MRTEDMILVSIDDHVIEPPDMYKNHVPAKWLDEVPKVVRNDVGVDEWVFQGQKTSTPFGMAATVGWPRARVGVQPGLVLRAPPRLLRRARARARHERQRRAHVDVLPHDGRVQRAHVHRGRRQGARARDAPGLQRLAHRRVVRRLPGPVHPARHRARCGTSTWRSRRSSGSPRRAAARSASSRPRTRRVGRASCRATGTRCSQALVDENMVLCLHIGGAWDIVKLAPEAPVDHMIVIPSQLTMLTAQDLLFGPTLRRYPDLKVALSEGGIGWIPFYLDRVDRHFQNQSWIDSSFGEGKLPSDVFREHFLACYITDPAGLKLRHEIGMDVIAWECDYPHTDTTWPDSPEFAAKEFQDAGCHRRGDPQDHLGERDEVLHLGPVRPHSEGAGHGGSASGPGHRRRHHPDAPRGVAQAQRGRRHRRPLRFRSVGVRCRCRAAGDPRGSRARCRRRTRTTIR